MKQKFKIWHGMSTRDALRIAVRLGSHVCHRRGTGELIVSHPLFGRVVHPVPNRRKTASRALTAWLKKLWAAVCGRS